MSFRAEDPMIPKQAGEAIDLPSRELVQLIHAQRGHMSTRQRALGAQTLLARLTKSRRGVRLSARSFLGTALAVVAFAAASWVVMSARGRFAPGALSYAVEDGHVSKGGLIEGDSSSSPRLRFSDGTEVVLSPKTKAALRSVDGHGAQMSLVEGRAHVDVVHKPAASWLFDAGPFQVVVTGTAFTVQWTPADEQLDLRMERGTVEVSGPLSDGAISLRSGQHLVVRVRQRETLIRDTDDIESPPPDLENAVRAGDGSVDRAAEPPPSSLAASAGPKETPIGKRALDRSWASELADGDFENIVRQAERRGLDTSLAEASSADLAALADAARYGRHDDVARRALLAQRRRFPLAPAARDASFLLGRLEEAQHDVSGALDWFDRYLDESPLGTYTSEALGRKMILIQQLYGDERARPVALEYLNRFAQGTYAARARALARAQ
jgi:TolA-binding protein